METTKRFVMSESRKIALAYLVAHGMAFVSMMPVGAPVIRGLAKAGLVIHRTPERVGRHSKAKITPAGRDAAEKYGARCACIGCRRTQGRAPAVAVQS